MRRRSFLAALAGAPVAAPAAAEAMMTPKTVAAPAGVGGGLFSRAFDEAQTGLSYPEQMRLLAGDPTLIEAMRAVIRREVMHYKYPPDALDGDLRENKSFSLETKARMQREREIEKRVQIRLQNAENVPLDLLRKAGINFW